MHTQNEITAWLEPLFEAAERTDIDLWAIVEQATVAVAEGSALRHSRLEPRHRGDTETHLGSGPTCQAPRCAW